VGSSSRRAHSAALPSLPTPPPTSHRSPSTPAPTKVANPCPPPPSSVPHHSWVWLPPRRVILIHPKPYTLMVANSCPPRPPGPHHSWLRLPPRRVIPHVFQQAGQLPCIPQLPGHQQQHGPVPDVVEGLLPAWGCGRGAGEQVQVQVQVLSRGGEQVQVQVLSRGGEQVQGVRSRGGGGEGVCIHV
jgi:hypothetical protein